MIATPSVSSFGRRRCTAPSITAVAKFGQRADLFQPAAPLDRLAQIDEHDDARLRGHAETGDEAHLHRHAVAVAR